MKKKIVSLSSRFKISILDQYIIKELIPTFVFSIAICSILGELIGISFENMRFVVEKELPIFIAVYIHWLKLPAFICVALPFALLISTIIIYRNLSNRNEIIALQSFGISLYRLMIPSLLFACILAAIMFMIQEIIVPPANYEAAMVLENQFNIDRSKLAKYNKEEIIYQEFETDNHQKHLKLLFFAEGFDGEKMRGITLLKFQQRKLSQIIVADSAQWNEKQQKWQFFSGIFNPLSSNGTYLSTNNFEKLYLKLTRNILDYANHHRDNREMNIIDLFSRLEILQHTQKTKMIRELKISIQQRYAAPVSCLIFTFLGAALGISSKTKASHSSLGISAIIIFGYYSIQFLSTALSVAEVISIFWGVWLPNLLGLSIGCFMLKRT